ncbi:hypothetical protein BD779DRAFT_1473985 [Infundibulicybe gibba]|nr:hypothetical protein BD779DRAFT_1473985 [Infundibulicybe gibba]
MEEDSMDDRSPGNLARTTQRWQAQNNHRSSTMARRRNGGLDVKRIDPVYALSQTILSPLVNGLPERLFPKTRTSTLPTTTTSYSRRHARLTHSHYHVTPITPVDKQERKIPTPHINPLQPADNESSMAHSEHDQKVSQSVRPLFSSYFTRLPSLSCNRGATPPQSGDLRRCFTCQTIHYHPSATGRVVLFHSRERGMGFNGCGMGYELLPMLITTHPDFIERKENTLELLSYDPGTSYS